MLKNQQNTKPLIIKVLGMMPIGNHGRKTRYGIFECPYCKKEYKTRTEAVARGDSTKCKSCATGIRNKTHGISKSKLYKVWSGMIQRCSKNKHYHGRGITVCERWKEVTNFVDDMYPTYKEGLSIDRINNDGNYEPSNCRWTTKIVQSRNTRKIYSHNKSGYRGVYFAKKDKVWVSNISKDNKCIRIGSYKDPKYAAMAYDTFVIVYGLEHTTNFPKGVFAR